MTKNNLENQESHNAKHQHIENQEDSSPPKADYRHLYLKEKSKGNTLLVITVALTILFVGSLAWGVTQTNQKPKDFNTRSGRFENQMGPNGQGGREQGMMKMNFKRFLKSDGSVDTTEITDFISRMPATAQQNIQSQLSDDLGQAVKDSTITQDQATAIKNAINTAVSSGTSNKSNN